MLSSVANNGRTERDESINLFDKSCLHISISVMPMLFKKLMISLCTQLDNYYLVLTVSLLVASWKLPLGYRYISTLSDFLIMMLFINAAENLRKISTRIHFSVKSEIHQMMILTKRVLGQRDPKHE